MTDKIEGAINVAEMLAKRHQTATDRIWQYGSSGRPWAFLAWINDRHPIEFFDTELGKHFWKTLKEHWSGFDKVPHEHFAHWMRVFGAAWEADEDWEALPGIMKVYRGQDADADVGLSWTLDRKVAHGFAVGHRAIRNQRPVILTAIVPRHAVAMAIHSRDEQEIVLFMPPKALGIRVRKERIGV